MVVQVDVCHVQFTVDIQYTGSVERAQTSISSSTEQPTCAVCLGKFFLLLSSPRKRYEYACLVDSIFVVCVIWL